MEKNLVLMLCRVSSFERVAQTKTIPRVFEDVADKVIIEADVGKSGIKYGAGVHIRNDQIPSLGVRTKASLKVRMKENSPMWEKSYLFSEKHYPTEGFMLTSF